MAPRKFVRISMIIDHSKIYDILELAENNALAGSLEIVPVRHGGEKESGELTPAPTPETFLNDYLSKHKRIDTKDAIPLGEKAGLTRNSIYAQIKRMSDRKQIKRVDVGAYIPAARKGRAPAVTAKAPAPAKAKRQHYLRNGETVPHRLMREIAAQQQNGSGEGVSLTDLKTAMAKEGYVATGVGPALTALVNSKQAVRVGKGMYRTSPVKAAREEGQPTPQASSTEG